MSAPFRWSVFLISGLIIPDSMLYLSQLAVYAQKKRRSACFSPQPKSGIRAFIFQLSKRKLPFTTTSDIS